jgi:TP901 family phage tail tape measure protein
MQNIEVALKLVDKFSAELKKMGEAVQGLEGSIQKQVKQMNSHFDHLQSSISKTAQSTQKHFQGMQNGMSAMSTNFVKNALAMGAGIFAIDKAAEALMSFDDARARVVGLAGLKGKDVQTLTDSALKIGGSTEFSATDVMSAYAVNARMIKDVKTLQEVTAVQTNLATLGQTSITDIAQNSSTLVTILGLNGEEMIKFGDSVAYMMTRNNKSIVANLEALTEAAPLLKQFGNDFNDAVALVGIAPSIQTASGSELGTKFRAMITEGLNSTVRLARKGNVDNMNVIKNLGLSPDDLDLSKRKLIDVLQSISDARKKGGKLDSHGLFGSYGMELGNALVDHIEELKKLRAEADNVKGKLGEMSAPMRATLRANLGNAMGAVEALIVKMGDAGLTGAIISVANAFEGFVNFLAKNPIIVNVATEVLLFVAGLWSLKKILTPIIAGFMMLRRAALILRVGMILAGGALPALTAGFSALFLAIRVAFTANPLGVLITGIMLAVEAVRLLIKLWKKLKGETDVPQAVQGGQSQAVQGGAFWETKDGQMTPYTQQSKQKITTDVNVIFENPPEGTKAVATQRGTSGVDVGTTSIIQSLYRHALGSLL